MSPRASCTRGVLTGDYHCGGITMHEHAAPQPRHRFRPEGRDHAELCLPERFTDVVAFPELLVNSRIIAALKVSSAAQRLATTARAPAATKGRTRLATPSCPCSVPVLVSHADSVTNVAFRRRFKISRAWRRPSSASDGLSTR